MASLWQPTENIDPIEGLHELYDAAMNTFPRAFEETAAPIPITKSLQHRFSGLVMLADWLGSHSEAFFPYHHTGDRWQWSRNQAKRALLSVGLDVQKFVEKFNGAGPAFSEVFDVNPYPLQEFLSNSDLPPLLIAESDTGSGKTEAALIHFLSLFAAGKVDSLYFALPTRVAAHELYQRVLKSMQTVFGNDCPPTLLAVPGYTLIDGEPPNLLPSQDPLWCEPEQQRRERQWSAERPKRFLAATIAVGTIDQALLSTIRVPHAHLRRVCLDRALLVIDEVHSSDVYMRALSRKMLSEHLKVGGRALLLSATLGNVARDEYLSPDKRVEPRTYQQSETLPYPCLSLPENPPESFSKTDRKPKKVHIDPVKSLESPQDLIPRLKEAVNAGQRVMVVSNTVKRAIDLTRQAEENPALANALFSCNGVHCPHHGRFSKSDRELLDKSVSTTLGKGSSNGAALLIGTQTLEQSLDIDADWLISDLCPIDVLLQRIGRLHRHDLGERPEPVCTILFPGNDDLSQYIRHDGEVTNGAPAGLGSVYEDLRILQLTHNILTNTTIFHLPQDNRHLVEAATHPEKLATLEGDPWCKHSQHLEGTIQAMLMAAHGTIIPDEHFGDFSFPTKLESRLTTRLGLNNRRLLLGGNFPGPFGRKVYELNIPGYMARELDTEEADSVEVKGGGLLIYAGRYVYQYSRFGLEQHNEPSDR